MVLSLSLRGNAPHALVLPRQFTWLVPSIHRVSLHPLSTFCSNLPFYLAQVCSLNEFGVAEATGLGPQSANYQCVSGKMRSASMWLGIWAGVLIVLLMCYEIKAAIMYGVLFATIISWIPGGGVGRKSINQSKRKTSNANGQTNLGHKHKAPDHNHEATQPMVDLPHTS